MTQVLNITYIMNTNAPRQRTPTITPKMKTSVGFAGSGGTILMRSDIELNESTGAIY
jgi:hypothetical protein